MSQETITVFVSPLDLELNMLIKLECGAIKMRGKH